eukprot:5194672-Amphidinium_carterae.1
MSSACPASSWCSTTLAPPSLATRVSRRPILPTTMALVASRAHAPAPSLHVLSPRGTTSQRATCGYGPLWGAVRWSAGPL